MMALRQTKRGFTLVDCFAGFARSGLCELLLTDQEAREQYVQRNEGRFDPTELKDDALYVDLTVEGTLRVPCAAVKFGSSAEMYVTMLANHLSQFVELADLLTNDRDWNPFANEIRRRIGGAGGPSCQ